jgi:TPR repeat protein
LADEPTEEFFPCCGKRICRGCEYSFNQTGNESNCPFCNSDHGGKPVEEEVADMMKRVAANDPASICMLATHYHLGRAGFQQNHAKTVELLTKSAELGFSKAHSLLGNVYYIGGTSKKAKFHYEAAAMAGDEVSRYNLAICENELGNMDRAVKHLKIGASAGDSRAMHQLRTFFEEGTVSRESIDSTLIAYNNSCAEMRSEARDAYMRRFY